jgi:hypothetical protein
MDVKELGCADMDWIYVAHDGVQCWALLHVLMNLRCRGLRMCGAILPLQYAFMVWCSVKKSTGTTLPLPQVP